MKVLLELLNVSDFFSLDQGLLKIKIISFDLKQSKLVEFEEKFLRDLSPP